MNNFVNCVRKGLIPISFFLLCMGTLFLFSDKFITPQVAPKWYCFYYGVSILIILSIWFFSFAKKEIILSRFSAAIVISCTLLALYGVGQAVGIFSSAGYFVVGNFDNPAGFASSLCVGFPFVFYYILAKEKRKRIIGVLFGLVILTAIALSESRAGVICIIVTIGIVYYPFLFKRKIYLLITILFLVSLFLALYFLKVDSANGRLLIWGCTWEMISDSPLFGYGLGGFKANYMDYQADFFRHNPHSSYTILADNTQHSFNEYLLLLVNFGFVGFGLFVLGVIFLIKSYLGCKENNVFLKVSALSLFSIAIFSLFSYPLDYPFVWVAGILSCFTILYQRFGQLKQNTISFAFKIVLTILMIFSVVKITQQMNNEILWNKVALRSLNGDTRQMLPLYERLHPKLQNNELFLYNYAAELNNVKYYNESLEIAKKCEGIWSDYYLQMLIADNYQNLKQFELAEYHYRKASNMCPVKFMPLYYLVLLYMEMGQKKEALKLARQILDKEIKVPSSKIDHIKHDMARLINSDQ